MEELKNNFSSFFHEIEQQLQNKQQNTKYDPEPDLSTVKKTNGPSYASTVFKLPVDYLNKDQKHSLSPVVVSDLEMV